MSKLENTLEKKQYLHSSWVSLFLKMMSEIKYGSVSLTTPDGEQFNYRGTEKGEHVSIKICDWKFCDELFLKGDIGLGESYIAGLWESDNINGLIKFGIDNKAQLERVIRGSFFKILIYRIKHLLNKNSKKGSQKNIHAHYDLGNNFYKLWLDQTMTYSSGYFQNTAADLLSAQVNKYKNIFDQLNLKEGDHILEVGCGWGGFMEYAAQRGVKVTGITISKEQYDFAKKRLDIHEDLVTIKLMDYRDIEGKYDHIVSIEMFEALGQDYWSTYFKILKSALKDNGKMIIQSITINDQDFRSYSKGTDFIQQYIFPGGMLPSPSIFKLKAEEIGLQCIGGVEFGRDYATTLKLWEENFSDKLEVVKSIGFDDKFIRTWKFYLKYCQGGFEAGKISVHQFYLTKKV
ncbi:MAG: cyclopropane-fatty-acyl-phospholipid synthase family protein, partial [Bdellovibrionales bacterium]|nr:cyclopropane-fatty-acyl-phospholipid synthase family protein [Bdellovibrionales bacterium]